MKETARYIIGYILGFALFVVLIPFGLVELSKLDYLVSGRLLFNSAILRYIVSSMMFIIGACFAIWSNIFLYNKGKGGPTDVLGVSISPQTRKLVTTGPYRYCRNPMVFGAFSLYLSIVLYLNSITGLVCLLVFLIIAIRYLRVWEEKRLIKDFGNEYMEYKKKVPMIFPMKWISKLQFLKAI